MRRLAVQLGFIILLGGGYLGAYDSPLFPEIAPTPVHLEAASPKTLVIDVKGKILSPLSLNENVWIGGHRFEVPPPWRGHRIEGETARGDLDFARLPAELVAEGGEIYVTRTARDAFVRMARAAAVDGVRLLVDSGYRSAEYQQRIYRRKMAEGEDFYDIAQGVAPPGYSEHMLGTAIDLVPSKWTFKDTPADKWMRENGAAYSFNQSYPQKSDRGFTWEPWHWKYVGDG
ncbi:MAG: M15 family metallopeptidase [Desulfurivibrionaceae bacterium]|nr:M15 family metallopeptidase [Desulfobulbales bacterium]MDT8334476.1 M15 family metallopeptidase [Desulfurivibrionaceae bacterium]